ncbi:MAG: serine/threonine protein kinase [Rubritalea sp.]|jgi:serine/threonine protein kinase
MSDNAPQAPSPEHLAELLPQYGIDSFIAQGGMGAVYRGRQLSLDREVAIKVLLYEYGEDTEFIESFTTEAKAMARLNHTNLLGVFDYGNLDGMPYIVMEYVEGGRFTKRPGTIRSSQYRQPILSMASVTDWPMLMSMGSSTATSNQPIFYSI